MRNIAWLVLVATCVVGSSCRHAPPKGATEAPKGYLGRTHYASLDADHQGIMFANEVPAEPVQTIGLRLEVRGDASIIGVERHATDDPIDPTTPPGDKEGNLSAPCKRVDVHLLKPIPAGKPIEPKVWIRLDHSPSIVLRVAVTPILASDPGKESATADPLKVLSTASKSGHEVDGKMVWETTYQYSYSGWALDPYPHAGLTIPVDAPRADDFQVEDVLPDGTVGVRVEAIGFRLGSLTIDAYDGVIQDATVDGARKDGVRPGRFWSEVPVASSLSEATIRFARAVPPDSAGLVSIYAGPVDRKAPVKGTLRITYLAEGK